jgi:hypothetical protein
MCSYLRGAGNGHGDTRKEISATEGGVEEELFSRRKVAPV